MSKSSKNESAGKIYIDFVVLVSLQLPEVAIFARNAILKKSTNFDHIKKNETL